MSTSENDESNRLHILDLCRPGVPLEYANWRSEYDYKFKKSLTNPENENEWLVMSFNDYDAHHDTQLWP